MINNKLFLLPWQVPTVSYDALLSLSLTVSSECTDKVYMTEYTKTSSNININLDVELVDGTIVPLVRFNAKLNRGIQLLELPTNDLLVRGSITIISTHTLEQYKEHVQLSPRFIQVLAKTSNDSLTNSTVNETTNVYVHNETSINLQANDLTIDFGQGLMQPTVISNDSIPGYSTINEESPEILENGKIRGIIKLPDYFKVEPIGDEISKDEISKDETSKDETSGDKTHMYRAAAITGNTQNTCKTESQAESLFDPRNHDINSVYPLDVCYYQVMNSEKTVLYIFRPEVIDKFTFTAERLRWYEDSIDY